MRFCLRKKGMKKRRQGKRDGREGGRERGEHDTVPGLFYIGPSLGPILLGPSSHKAGTLLTETSSWSPKQEL